MCKNCASCYYTLYEHHNDVFCRIKYKEVSKTGYCDEWRERESTQSQFKQSEPPADNGDEQC